MFTFVKVYKYYKYDKTLNKYILKLTEFARFFRMTLPIHLVIIDLMHNNNYSQIRTYLLQCTDYIKCCKLTGVEVILKTSRMDGLYTNIRPIKNFTLHNTLAQ